MLPSPLVTLLQTVATDALISNAPGLLEKARKLWSSAVKKVPVESKLDASDRPQERLAALELATSELHSQMLASSELLKELAEHNTQLIARIEANRLRTMWLAGVMAAFAVTAVLGLVFMLVR